MQYAILPILTLAALAQGCTRAEAAPGDDGTPARHVVVETIEEAPFAPLVTATGAVAGKEEIPLSFKIGGLIAQITVDEGQRVAAGQSLAELSQTEISAVLAKAVEGRAKARRDLDRVMALHVDSVAPQAQLDDARTALEVAEQDVKAVEFNRALSVIRAPAAGVILARRNEPNEMAAPNVPVLVLRTDRRGLILRAGLADRDAMRVRLGDAARVTLDALPGEVLRGRVTQRAAAASPNTGTFEVEVALSTKAPLATGLIGRVEIAAQSLGTYPVLPLDALLEASGDSGVVFVIPPGADTVQRRVVRVAQVTAEGIAVASGLLRGERVVVRGGAYVLPGDRVIAVTAGGTK